MDFGICLNPLIPLRASPNERSEMTDQILFGESFRIYEYHDQWQYVERIDDGYTGWFNNPHYLSCSEADIQKMARSSIYTVNQPFSRCTFNSQHIFIPAGSRLPFFHRHRRSFILGNDKYFLHEELLAADRSRIAILKETALNFLNAPYLWGGKTIFGIDCSGFIQVVFRIAGIDLPRDSHKQLGHGRVINSLEDAQPGDLLFFGKKRGDINHIGMLLEAGKIIHASGKVRVNPVDLHGIYSIEGQRYTHALRAIKSLIA